MASRQFIGRRGQVKEIRSDNGTNFTGGERELRESIGSWNHNKIHKVLLQKNIKWIFNPLPTIRVKLRRRWKSCIRTFQKKDSLSRRRWRQMQYLAEMFLKRWSRENLPLLQSRQKWTSPCTNLAVGDVFLISAENSPCNTWPLGRVVEVLLAVWFDVPRWK